MVDTWLIVGLGNIGNDYTNTRHNAGFIILDEILNRLKYTTKRQEFDGLIYETNINESRCLFIKPQTYVNNSGSCVYKVAEYYKIPLNHMIILTDDTNFEIGKIRIKQKGSAGGHKGINSIIESFKTEQFIRIKIGVNAKPNKFIDLKDWVVSKFSDDELTIIKCLSITILDIIKLILDNNIQKAMNLFNRNKDLSFSFMYQICKENKKGNS